jgi:hypothetical protein
VQQKLASGFNRNHMIDYEGRAIPEEYRVEYVADSQQPTKPSQGHPAKDPAKEPSQGALDTLVRQVLHLPLVDTE